MKVGDYVRTKDGRIFKWNKLCTIDKKDYEEHSRKVLFVENEIKSSPNIIDLIEVGDYVNGYKVDKVEERYIWFGDERLTLAYKFNYDKYSIKTENIKSIVTKEQFESMEYKIGE